MMPLTLADIQILIASSVFILGLLCNVLGIIVLMTRGYSREVKSLATHTARIGQKGLTQDVAGLVQSASELVNSINGLVRTASGVGVFLISLGLLMIAGAYWVVSNVNWTVT